MAIRILARPRWCALTTGFAMGLALSAAGCVPGVSDQTKVPLPAALTAVIPQLCTGATTYCVSTTGLDTNAGNNANPFRTITHALSVATPGQSIQVLPGFYDAAAGETFPLNVPANVSLIGDEPSKGFGATPTNVQGTGVVPGVNDNGQGAPAEALIVPGAGATVAGLYMTGIAPAGGNAGELVLIQSPVTGVILRNNTIRGAQTNGVLEQSPGTNTLLGNVIFSNGFAGFASDCSTTATPPCAGGSTSADVMQGNTFANNGAYGAFMVNSAGGGGFDFGGGGGSTGLNVFCGSSIGFIVNIFPGAVVNTGFNYWWYASPPTPLTTITPSTDIVNNNGNSTVNYLPDNGVVGTCP